MNTWKQNVYFVLVEPGEPGNIGASARAIKNMGFRNLCLVKPPAGITEEGRWFARNANDVLDYFGHTINLAARFQRLCRGGEIVLSTAMADEPGVSRLLRQMGAIQAVREKAVVRGLTEPVQVLRLRPEAVRETEAAPMQR